MRTELLTIIGLMLAGLHCLSHAGTGHNQLQVSANNRYLEWQHGEPFFMHADTAWGLASRYKPHEVSQYLDRCVLQGFNTILLSADFPQNGGSTPLATGFENQDLSKPNPLHWAHVDWVVREITKRGLVASLNPFWKKGADEILLKNGEKNCRNFGRWFAQRYQSNPRITFFIGGDQGPGKASAELNALGEGIQEVCKGNAILAYHNGSDRTSLEAYPKKPDWLTWNWTYAYSPDYRNDFPYQQNLESYHTSPRLPIFFSEGYYSFLPPRHFRNKPHGVNNRWGTRFALRRQAWWASFLSGSSGHAYGAEPIWGYQREQDTWKDALKYESRTDMKHLIEFVNQVDWWTFIPDSQHHFLLSGGSKWRSYNYAVAAVSKDKTTAIIYTPAQTLLELDTSQLSPGQINAQWFDPSSGTYTSLPSQQLKEYSSLKLLSPAKNAAGDPDFVLIITVNKDQNTSSDT